MDRAATALPTAAPSTATSAPKRLNVFERYLSLWVGLCMAVGVVLGLTASGMMRALRSVEFGAGSQINVPIAILIWLMITPMMMKVDFGSIRNVGRRPRGVFVTLFVSGGPNAGVSSSLLDRGPLVTGRRRRSGR
jgi:ACR3 family arsenite transporter